MGRWSVEALSDGVMFREARPMGRWTVEALFDGSMVLEALSDRVMVR